MPRKRNEPSSSPPAELLRLAEDGARNIQRADRGRAAEADRHLRIALGAHYGALLPRLALLPLLAGAGFIAGAASENLPPDWLFVGISVALLGLFGVFFLDPAAGRGRVERLVPYVHRLIDEVLAPLHATYPLAAVALTRAA